MQSIHAHLQKQACKMQAFVCVPSCHQGVLLFTFHIQSLISNQAGGTATLDLAVLTKLWS